MANTIKLKKEKSECLSNKICYYNSKVRSELNSFLYSSGSMNEEKLHRNSKTTFSLMHAEMKKIHIEIKYEVCQCNLRAYHFCIEMNFFTRCFNKKESSIEQNRKRIYNEHHFSSGMDLPIQPKTIYPSNILDKELVIGQFGEPQKAQRFARALNTENS